MATTLLLYYHPLAGVPEGRAERERVLVISGELAQQMFECATPQADPRFVSDLVMVQEVYVYMGRDMKMGKVEVLIRNLQSVGKKVNLVGCNCDENGKRALAEKLGIEWIRCECGGYDFCLNFIALHA